MIVRIEAGPVRKTTAAAGGEAVGRDVAARVAESLKASGYAALKSVTAEHRGGAILLRGSVPSFYMKQIAQAVASKVHGVAILVNLLSVDSGAGRP